MTNASRRSFWKDWLNLNDGRSGQDIEEEIAEELQLHFDLMVEEELRSGASLDEAKWRATEKFGNRDSIAAKCKQIQTWEYIMLQRLQIGLIGILIVIMGFSYLNSMSLSNQLGALETQLIEFKQSLNEPSEKLENTDSSLANNETMEIFVCDEYDQPIPHALVTVMSWNQPRDNQISYRRKVDSEGKLTLLKDNTRIVSRLTGFAEGRAPTTLTLSESRQDYYETQKLTLKPTIEQDLMLIDEQGNPIKNSKVSLLSREGDNVLDSYANFNRGPHFYHDSLGLWDETDSEGNVTISWFAEGDSATINVSCYEENKETRFYTGKFEVPKTNKGPITVQLESNSIGGGTNYFNTGGGGVF